MSDTTAGLFDGLPDAPQGAEKRDPTFIPLAQQEKDRQDMEDLPDAPDAPSIRDFTAWRATAPGTTPAHAAEVLRYAANFKLPSKFVHDNFDQVKAKADSGEFNNRLSYAPTVERFISQDPILGAATKDDLPQLGWIERNITGKWERIPGAQPWTGDPTQQMVQPPKWILKLGEGALEVKKSLTATGLALLKDGEGDFKGMVDRVHKQAAEEGDDDPETKEILADLDANVANIPNIKAQDGRDLEQADEELKTTSRAIGPETLGQRIAMAPFKMAPYMAGVAASSLVAGPLGAYKFNWSQSYGNDYLSFRAMRRKSDGAQLLTDEEARSYANMTANFSAGIQTVLDVPVLKGLPLGEALAQRLTGQAVAEALGETGSRYVAREFVRGGIHLAAGAGLMATQAGAERAGEYAARVTHGEDDNASEIATATLHGFVNALPDFLAMSAWGPGKALMEETGRRFNAVRESARLQQITDAARDSLIVQQNPGAKAEELIAAMAADSDAKTVYVTLDQWKKHWQGEGLDPAEVAARVMGDGGQGYAAADASKGDLQIPIEKYVTQLAPKGHTDALQEFVKLSQDGITPAEYKDQIRAQLKLLVDNAPARDAYDAVREDYRARAMAAGVSKTEAQANADFVARALTLWADSQGQGKSALDLYRENPTEIVGAKGQRLAASRAPGAEPAIARAAQGDLQQAAWHGSPHKFERFSMQHIGSGEGAQVYGHGLYFAQNPEVAKFYRDTLTDHSVRLKNPGALRDDGPVQSYLSDASRMAADRGPEAVLEEAVKQAQAVWADAKIRRDEHVERVTAATLERLKKLAPDDIELDRGVLYKVDVPEGDRLLDYDKKLAAQPKGIQDAVIKALAANGFKLKDRAEFVNGSTGGDVVRVLSQYVEPEEASAALRDAGVPGLQYLDHGSRKDGTGSHNFVIWDDKEIKTLQTLFQQGTTVADLDGVPAILREDERGFVRIFAGGDGSRSYEINLRNPDRSTLAHETFHVLSVVMGDVAQTAKDPQLKADYDAMLKAMGYADHEERQTALDPAKEERGSHWWEQYLAEGKAPTPELAGAFQRFKGWLLKIYKGVQGVATQYRVAYGKELPQMSDEVRGIFDRMLASQDAIDAARGSTGGDAFTKELQKKLPENAAKAIEQGRVYALTAQEQELAAQMKDAESAHSLMEKEQAKIRAEVTSEANADPAQRAMHFLQTGEFKSLGGELQPVMSEVLKMGDGSVPKLDRQMIVDRYGQEVADALPRDVLRHDGVNPDVLAPAFGYASSMEMVHALASLPTDPSGAIEQEVRQRMAERFPNLLNDPQALATAALETVHGEHQATQIVRELRALAEHVDPSLKPKAAAINMKAIREVARRLIADKSVGQLSPDYYLKAEREAAQRAFEAMRKGDTAEAFGERSAQLLNRSLWREAKDAKESADSAVKYLRAQLEDTPRAMLGKAGPEFLAGVDAVLSALRLEKNDQAVQPAPDAGAYDALAARMKDAQVELDPNDAAALRQLLVQPKDWSKLRLDELQNVRDFVKTARTVARAVNEVNVLGKKLDLVGVTQQLRAEALAGNKDLGPQVDDQSQISRVQRLQAGVRAWDAAALRAETLLRKLGTMGGQLFDNYINARNAKEKLAATILKDFNDSMERAGKDFRDRLDEVLPLDKDLPQNGTDMGGPRSRRWLMMLALNMGNAGNIQRTTEGRSWSVEQVKNVIGQYLNRDELGFVQSRWDAMEPLGQLLAEKEARKTGLPLERVVALPLELSLADGSSITLPGGYFPAKYDPRVSRGGVGAQQEAAGGIQAFYGNDYRRATTQKSHVQQRAANYSNIVNLNWSVYPGHIAQVIHDITHDELVSDTAKVFNHPDTQYAVRHTLGIEGEQELRTWLKVVATQQTGSAPSSAEKALGPVFGWLRSRVVMSSIVGSAPVLISQVAHPLIAAGGGELGLLSAAASLPKALLPDVRQFARDNSPGEIAHREQRATAALNERLRELGAPEKGLLALAGHIVERGMHAVDGYVSTAVWTAAMNDALAMKDENGARVHDEASAYKYADDKLRQVMPTHEKAEMPALLRDKGLVGSLLMAHGFQNTLYNIARTSWHERGPIEATGRILAMTLVSGLAGGLLLGHGKEDDESWGQWALRKALASPFELIPFLPNATEFFIDRAVTGKTKKADVRNAPFLAGAQTLMEGYGRLASDNATDQDKFWAAAELLLFAGKLPSRQISRTGQYLQTEAGSDISHGRVGNVLSGVAYGPKEKRKNATPIDAATDLATTITR